MTFYKIFVCLFSVFSDSEGHIFKLFFSNLLLKYASVAVKAGFLNELWLKEMIFKGIMIYSSTGIGRVMREKHKKSGRARQNICLTRNCKKYKIREDKRKSNHCCEIRPLPGKYCTDKIAKSSKFSESLKTLQYGAFLKWFFHSNKKR